MYSLKSNNSGFSQIDIARNLKWFVLGLIAIELITFGLSIADSQRYGDFAQTPPEYNPDLLALLLGIGTWAIPLVLVLACKSHTLLPKYTLKNGAGIYAIFLMNFAATILFNIGVVGEGKSSLGFLTTILPINYLIFFVVCQDKNRNSWFLIALLVLTDLYRQLFGVFLKIGYLIAILASARIRKYLLICSPLLFIIVKEGLIYKMGLRGLDLDEQTLIAQAGFARVASVNTYNFVLSDLTLLAEACSDNVNVMVSFFLSLIPKAIFGLEMPLGFNSCYIAHYIGTTAIGSSVNAPFLANLILLSKISFLSFLQYFIFVSIVIAGIIFFSNYLLGKNSIILNYWILAEFFWTGNILSLSIPMYFLMLLYIFVNVIPLKRNDRFGNMVLKREI